MSAAVDAAVVDRIAIEELFNRFADALDRKEFEKLVDFLPRMRSANSRPGIPGCSRWSSRVGRI